MFGIMKEDFVSFWGKGLMFGIKKDFCDFLGKERCLDEVCGVRFK